MLKDTMQASNSVNSNFISVNLMTGIQLPFGIKQQTGAVVQGING